ncbi:MAG TPA: TolC family protein, partial [Bacteroidia bacterium]|nr:TolC family protein [Bacteroidia bacterium]
FTGFNAGIALPLTFISNKQKVKSLALQYNALQTEADQNKLLLQTQLKNAQLQYHQALIAFDFYKNTLQQAHAISNTAYTNYSNGNIGYVEYLQALENASDIKLNYLKGINQINQNVLSIHYLINQ